MSHWANYLREREGFESIETDQGFVTYKRQSDGSFYIRDIYVAPDFRRDHVASSLADRVLSIAKDSGAAEVFGTVSASDPNATRSIEVLIRYGMTFRQFNPQLNLLVFGRVI